MRYLFIFYCVLFFSCNVLQSESIEDICYADKKLEDIKNININDSKKLKEYDSTLVNVVGYFHYNFEDVALYDKPSSTNSTKTKRAVWINFIEKFSIDDDKLRKLNSKKVSVVGKLNTNNSGHLSLYSASLDSVFCIKIVD